MEDKVTKNIDKLIATIGSSEAFALAAFIWQSTDRGSTPAFFFGGEKLANLDIKAIAASSKLKKREVREALDRFVAMGLDARDLMEAEPRGYA